MRGRCSSRTSGSGGASSSANRAFLMFSGPRRVNSWPLRGVAGRQDAVEEVDAAAHRFDEIGRGADAHQVARLVCRQPRRRGADDLVHHGDWARPRSARRSRSPRSRSRPACAALSARRSVNTPPCTMPNCACPGVGGAPARRRRRRESPRAGSGTAPPTASSARATRESPPRSTDAADTRRAPWRCRSRGRPGCRRRVSGVSSVRAAVEVRAEVHAVSPRPCAEPPG